MSTSEQQQASSAACISSALKEELANLKDLKPVVTEEKSILPTAKDIVQEKAQPLLDAIAGQDGEKLPALAHVDTVEKSVLPTAQDIAQEKKDLLDQEVKANSK